MRQDAESGHTILFGMGELQLEVTVEKLRARHRVNVGVGRPQVTYWETIAHAAEVTHPHKKQTGGRANSRSSPCASGGWRAARACVSRT